MDAVVIGRVGGLMASLLESRSCGLSSSPGQGYCSVLFKFWGKTLDSHSAYPDVLMGSDKVKRTTAVCLHVRYTIRGS